MYKYRFDTSGTELTTLGKLRFEMKGKREYLVEGHGMCSTYYDIESGYKYGDDFIVVYTGYNEDYDIFILVKEFNDIFKYIDKLKDTYTKTINYWKEFLEEHNE